MKGVDGKRDRFKLSPDAPYDISGYEIIPNSGGECHSDRCNKQVPIREQEFNLDNQDFLSKHEEAMVNNNMNRRRSKVIERENALSEIMENFHNLSSEEQEESVIITAFNIGNLGKMKIAEKSLEQSLTLEESFLD